MRPFSPSRLTLGATVPATLAAAFSIGLVLQAVPLERFAFRSFEALRTFDSLRPPFAAGRRYHSERVYGDLANLGNLAAFREYRSETFSTDPWGYRNLPDAYEEPPTVLLIGDSFGFAPGMDDGDTLSAQLQRLWGRGVYNACGWRAIRTAEILEMSRRLGMASGFVVDEFLERKDVPRLSEESRERALQALRKSPARENSIERRAGDLWAGCRLRILAQQAYRRVQNDRILPNPYGSNVAVRRLIDGRAILFSPSELKDWENRRRVSVDYWVRLRADIEKEGLRLVVLLVPNKYTVYAPLLSPPVRADSGDDYLERLEGALRGAGISVVNLKPTFQRLAREGLSRGEDLYWLDDIHWNPRGIGVAARELSRAIPPPSVPARVRDQNDEQKQQVEESGNREEQKNGRRGAHQAFESQEEAASDDARHAQERHQPQPGVERRDATTRQPREEEEHHDAGDQGVESPQDPEPHL